MSKATGDERPAWSAPELADPHANPDKAGKVRRMFAAIAGSYDLNNRLHSLWRDKAWRRVAARSARLEAGQRALDVACGTGDLTMDLAARTPATEVVGLDFTREMLDIARKKRDRLPPRARDKITYIEGDAQQLPFDDSSFHAVTIAFGLRNVAQPDKAVAEFTRVLAPGGRLVVLEFDHPRLAPLRWFSTLYTAHLMPRTATLISRDRSGAYFYLPSSVASFVGREGVGELMTGAGLTEAKHKSLTGGICVCSTARKPGI